LAITDEVNAGNDDSRFYPLRSCISSIRFDGKYLGNSSALRETFLTRAIELPFLKMDFSPKGARGLLGNSLGLQGGGLLLEPGGVIPPKLGGDRGEIVLNPGGKVPP